LQRALPHVRGFTYHAPEDGKYCFTVRTTNDDAAPPSFLSLTPQLCVLVDSAKPILQLEPAADAAGRVVLHYDVRDDRRLSQASVRLEAQVNGGAWESIQLDPYQVHDDLWVRGAATWRPPQLSGELRFRVTASDEAGNSAESVALLPASSLTTNGGYTPSPSADVASTQISRPFPSNSSSRPIGAQSSLSSIDWPAPAVSNSSPSHRASVGPIAQGSSDPFLQRDSSQRLAPPVHNSYSSMESAQRNRTPAHYAADHRGVAPSGANDADARGDASGISAPPLFHQSATAAYATDSESDASDLGASGLPANAAVRLVNARTFDIEYDLDDVGAWGIAKIEIWGTTDGGQSWRSFGVDTDNRSPMRVVVPSSGAYGFRIVVDSANALPSPPPPPGAQPEMHVAVDLNPPTARLLSAGRFDVDGIEELRIRWQAQDDNLEDAPIGLFFSSHPDGPWSPIATKLANTGQYAWRLERHVPDRFYVKLEAHDRAGNVTTYRTTTPVVLDRPQPQARLRDVRQVTP
jgi:hypothetical protein